MSGKKAYLIYVLLIFFIVVVLPVFLVKGLFIFPGKGDSSLIIKVYDHNLARIVSMEMNDYLKGVVAAEMPAAYHLEALKAQAVAARTYLLKQLPQYGGAGSKFHTGADICTDYRHSQAWISEKEMQAKWGFLSFFYYWARVSKAVETTKGEVLVYNNRLIDAVYHSNSGGKTEDAVYVWGRKTPYLVDMKSDYDQEGRNYKKIIKYSLAEFDRRLGVEVKEKLVAKRANLALNGKTFSDRQEEKIIDILKYSESGRVLEIKIDHRIYTGNEIRNKLSLPSTKFALSIEQDQIVCTVYGNGHGVGMSQEGANGYAKHGYNYQEILKHYYQQAGLANIF